MSCPSTSDPNSRRSSSRASLVSRSWWEPVARPCRSALTWHRRNSEVRTPLTATQPKWDDSAPVGTLRTLRGGGTVRKRTVRTMFVALLAIAFVIGQQMPAAADDPLQQALKQTQDRGRAVTRADASPAQAGPKAERSPRARGRAITR